MAALSSKKIALRALIFMSFMLIANFCSAEETTLFHEVPDLGVSGAQLDIAVSTSPLKKGRYRLEAVITKDGQTFPATFDKIEKNTLGRNSYVFSIISPKKDLRYQFFLRDGQNNLLAKSDLFSKARSCVTDKTPTYLQPADERDRVEQLATQAILLESEIKELNASYTLLKELKEGLDAQ